MDISIGRLNQDLLCSVYPGYWGIHINMPDIVDSISHATNFLKSALLALGLPSFLSPHFSKWKICVGFLDNFLCQSHNMLTTIEVQQHFLNIHSAKGNVGPVCKEGLPSGSRSVSVQWGRNPVCPKQVTESRSNQVTKKWPSPKPKVKSDGQWSDWFLSY